MKNHTPGPWIADECNILMDEGIQIAYVASSDISISTEQDKINAQLLALAPQSPHSCSVPGCPGPENKRRLEAFDELLAMAKRWRDGYVIGEGYDPHPKDDAIIAKAEGV